jgi:hypothetical protein
MGKREDYQRILSTLKDWEPFLLAESNLPGPRGNLELAHAAADLGTEGQFLRWAAIPVEQAPVNSPGEFLVVCGVIGLGRLMADRRGDHLATLRQAANDRRWRTREGVAMALQRLGAVDMDSLLHAMFAWVEGSPLEMRAAAAALCEPVLLKTPAHARSVLILLDRITSRLTSLPDRKSEGFIALRKGMAYCWSVAVAACPSDGKKFIEKWLTSGDPDVRWILRENLKKNRLLKMDSAWVADIAAKLTPRA